MAPKKNPTPVPMKVVDILLVSVPRRISILTMVGPNTEKLVPYKEIHQNSILLSVILSCNVIGQNVVTSLEINMDIVTYPREKKDIELFEFNTLFFAHAHFIF